MKSQNYFKWLIQSGWKQYLLPFLLFFIIDIVFLFNINSIIEETDSTIVVILMSLIVIIGTCAIGYHSYDFWKNIKNKK